MEPGGSTLFYSPLARLGLLALILVTAYAVVVGRRDTQTVALIHAANWVLVGALQPKHQHHVFPIWTFLVNLIGASLVTYIAARRQRAWMIVMASFLVLGVVGYVNYVTPNRGWHRAYVTSNYVWGFGALASLAFGAESERRRRLSQTGAGVTRG